MGVLAVDDVHLVLAGEVEETADGGDRCLRVRDEQAAAPANEVVLHVDDKERGPCRVEAYLFFEVVLRHLDRAVHDRPVSPC